MQKLDFLGLHLQGKYVESPEGVYFTYDDGKIVHFMYNMLGVNYLLREELSGETLFIEKEVLNKNPNLIEDIKKINRKF